MSLDTYEMLELQEEKLSKRAKILIIDDDDAAVDVLSYRLKNQGFTTATAETGSEGLAAVRSENPDLILLDLRLPDTDGFTICQKLADQPETCFIPVILFSGMDQADIVRQSRSAGAQFFLRKPYDPNVLLLVIQHTLNQTPLDDDGWPPMLTD